MLKKYVVAVGLWATLPLFFADPIYHSVMIPTFGYSNGSFATICLVVASFFLAVFIPYRMDNPPLRAAPAKVKEARLAYEALLPQIDARFPPYQMFRVPIKEVHEYLNDYGDDYPAINEYYPDKWKQMLEMYPSPPANDAEREKREIAFWKRYVGYFSSKNNEGQLYLKPKQEIIDYFKYWEKWIFRDFYAATGIIHKTHMEEYFRHIADVEAPETWKTYGDNRSLSNTQKRAAIEKAKDAKTRFVNETMPAHLEKWGGWFFFHIQEAFNGAANTASGFGPQSPTSQFDSTNDGLDYKAKA